MRGLSGILAVLVCAGASLTAPTIAHAQSATPSHTAPEAKSQALKHFERARELYRDGSYKEAIVALESAQRLDPDAKDLVYNLALVNEKLSRIDEALRWMHRYGAMDLDPAERSRSDLAIRRLEGAKKTLDEAKSAEPEVTAPLIGSPLLSSPPMGRIDTWTIATGAVAVIGIGVGTAFGISALSSKPKSGFVTGETGSYADLEDRAQSAHTRAVIADVGFGVGIASAAACALLYFSRTKDPEPTQGAAPPGKVAVSAWNAVIGPVHSGAALFFTGALP